MTIQSSLCSISNFRGFFSPFKNFKFNVPRSKAHLHPNPSRQTHLSSNRLKLHPYLNFKRYKLHTNPKRGKGRSQGGKRECPDKCIKYFRFKTTAKRPNLQRPLASSLPPVHYIRPPPPIDPKFQKRFRLSSSHLLPKPRFSVPFLSLASWLDPASCSIPILSTLHPNSNPNPAPPTQRCSSSPSPARTPAKSCSCSRHDCTSLPPWLLFALLVQLLDGSGDASIPAQGRKKLLPVDGDGEISSPSSMGMGCSCVRRMGNRRSPKRGGAFLSVGFRMPTTEVKSATSKKKKHCNCRNSKCLKMYCECFAAQVYCDGCNCSNCGNNIENENMRKEAIETLLARNPLAFQPKIENGPSTLNVRKDNSGAVPSIPKHNKGCHCKKSGCLKKYCECYQANVLCSKNCRCMDCKNFEGSDERKASIQGEYALDRNHIKQGANITHNNIAGSLGYNNSPVRRKRSHEDALGGRLSEGCMSEAQYRQVNPADVSLRAPSFTGCDGHNAAHSPPKSHNQVYRSPLANTIHESEVKDLVKHLVTTCRMEAEAYTALADNKVHETAEGNEFHTNDALSNGHCKRQDSKGTQTLICNELNATEMVSQWSDSSKDSRPASPATQALMCNEQDTTFGDDYRSSFPSISCDQDISEIHVAQESLVLTGLRDYLRVIITRGKINEHKSSFEVALGTHLDHGMTSSASPAKAEEKDTSSSDMKAFRSNQQSPSNDGPKGNN